MSKTNQLSKYRGFKVKEEGWFGGQPYAITAFMDFGMEPEQVYICRGIGRKEVAEDILKKLKGE